MKNTFKKLIGVVCIISLVFVMVSCEQDDVDKVLDDVDNIVSKNVDKMVEAEKNKSESVKEEPVKEEPVKEEPVKEEPVKEEPVKEEPVKEEPVKEEPVKEEPVKEEPVKEEPVKEVAKTIEVDVMLVNNNKDVGSLFLEASTGTKKDMQPGETKVEKVSLKLNGDNIEDTLVVNSEKDGKVISSKEAKIAGKYIEGKPILAIWDGTAFVVNY